MSVTPEEFQKKLNERIRQIDTAKLIYPVATKVHADMVERIFDNGQNGSGQKIGQYSTKAMYVVKSQFKKQGAFKARGKNSNKSTFLNKKPRRSMFLPNGYRQLKQIQGYQSEFVNLTYSSDLRNDFATKLAIAGDSVVVRLSRKINRDKVRWLRQKYGNTLWKHTQQERDFFIKEVTKNLIHRIEN